MSITIQKYCKTEQDLQWLQAIIEQRLNSFINQDPPEATAESDMNLTPPDIVDMDDHYSKFIHQHNLTPNERLVVLLALAPELQPELQPELLDPFLIHNTIYDKTFTEFGGVTTRSFNGFIPTIKTALFLLAGHRVSDQLEYLSVFDNESKLFAEDILRQTKPEEGCPTTHCPLALSDSALSHILTGKDVHYEYSIEFPARLLTTLMDWDDLVLPKSTELHLKELLAWPEHGRKLIDELQMGKNIQPGYRALFHGPSGTGKTLTAALIGKKMNKPVYRIDLSQLVSKYIGETEKNLEKIFSTAENYDWILFFDEADALFGKRTGISSSNDRFANQETAYLLQRIEMCNNIVILATNLKANVDEAFTRRFQTIAYFPMPGEEERIRLWQGAFSEKVTLDTEIDLNKVARKYDIAGGSIVNIVRYATLMAVATDSRLISYNDLMDGIRREYAKLGRTI